MTIPVVGAQDGLSVSVNTLVKSPNVIPRRMIKLLENQFVMDSLLRAGGDAPGGIVAYMESMPLFATGEPAIKEEFGEYKIIAGQDGIQRAVRAVNRGFAGVVSEEMRRRNEMDRLNLTMTQGRNTFTRAWENAVRQTLIDAAVPTYEPAINWDAANAKPREDILFARSKVTEAAPAGRPDEYFGFQPDTVLMSQMTHNRLLINAEFAKVFTDSLAPLKPLYTGTLPRDLLGMTVMTSRSWPNDEILLLERGTVGFIANERALRVTPLREDPDREVWRTNVSRISAIGIDNPLAAIRIIDVWQSDTWTSV